MNKPVKLGIILAQAVPAGYTPDEVIEAALALGVSMALGNAYTHEHVLAQVRSELDRMQRALERSRAATPVDVSVRAREWN